MHNVIRFPLSSLATSLVLASLLVACSSVDKASGEKIDYRGAKMKTTPLEVPPDLTQLAVDPRFLPQAGTVSASTLQLPASAASAASAAQAVAPQTSGDMKIERAGNQRWLTTTMTPEQLWPQLQDFWKERGFTLVLDQADVGVMETDWAENRAKIPNDLLRNLLGRVIDSLYSTGERDKFRTRVERTPTGSEVFISHRGVEEVYSNTQKDSTVWQPRPADPQLEGEFLSRLMVKLGAKATDAKTAAAQVAQAPVVTHARVVDGKPAATLQVDDGFDRAWRRVGLALDRSGFTVEDRDRAQGIFFVRYVDPAQAGKDEPGFFSKLFKGDKAVGPVRYRISVKAEGDSSLVSVLNTKGEPDNSDNGKRIVKLLVDDLK
jgi:outer membrane protein assembly factor BamC